LVNPSIFLLIAVLVGTLLYTQAGLEVPFLQSFIWRKPLENGRNRLVYGVVGGLLTGLALSLGGWLFQPHIPAEFTELSENLKLTLVAKLLYGGITEELLLRYGLMTLLVWLVFKLTKKLNNTTYWVGLLLSTLVFALGHFPVAFQAVESPSALLLTYILLGNSVGGLAFGWLYWKKGLESAFLAHMCAHLVMTGLSSLV